MTIRTSCSVGRTGSGVSSMGGDHKVLIKNIYYMMAYAFRALKLSAMEKLAAEEFDNIHDLMAAMFTHGVAEQLKRGMYREYAAEREPLQTLRGKLELRETVQNRLKGRRQLVCEYDELSENHVPAAETFRRKPGTRQGAEATDAAVWPGRCAGPVPHPVEPASLSPVQCQL